MFLDRALVIHSYTPVVSAVFDIKPSDHGRPLTDLASSIPLPTLKEDVERVSASGEAIGRLILQDREKRRLTPAAGPVSTRNPARFPWFSSGGLIEGEPS